MPPLVTAFELSLCSLPKLKDANKCDFNQVVGIIGPLYSDIVISTVTGWLFMAALCNRAGHYIFALWFLSSSLSFFFIFLA